MDGKTRETAVIVEADTHQQGVGLDGFATKEELRDWLIGEGYSHEAAIRFVESGWAPTFMSGPGLPGVVDGITAGGLRARPADGSAVSA